MARTIGGILRLVALLALPLPAQAAEGAGSSPLEAPALRPPGGSDHAPRLTGAEAWAKIVGGTIVGTTPDGPYRQSFAVDGTLEHVDRDGRQSGRWRLDDLRICLAFQDEDEECRRIEVDRDGREGAFIDSDGSIYAFEILAGPAKPF